MAISLLIWLNETSFLAINSQIAEEDRALFIKEGGKAFN
jgi:hypothetical protein